ncbi:MAG: dCMP deaminase family protein [Patescibacteria group bacterium]|nr:dCMP deaminase family protein [Patescibacteria group bacterium]
MTEKVEYRKNFLSWDECLMQIAHVISQRSKDPSTQAGAVIVNKDNVIVGLGYNGFPRGVDNDTFPWGRKGKLSQTKYAYVCHAEENAIYNANAAVKGAKIYCTLFPCNECAKTIVQTGIKEIIYESDKYHDDDIWIAARRIFDSAGVKYRQYKSKLYKK